MITHATPSDAQDICDLWNHYVDETIATFRPDRYTPELIIEIINEINVKNWGFVVAREEALLGFALYRQFRAGAGYIHSMENSLYLAPNAQRRGIGTALMNALEAHAIAHNVHSMTGVITSENLSSVAFHETLGYINVGEMPEIGTKFGKFHGVIFMQKILK